MAKLRCSPGYAVVRPVKAEDTERGGIITSVGKDKHIAEVVSHAASYFVGGTHVECEWLSDGDRVLINPQAEVLEHPGLNPGEVLVQIAHILGVVPLGGMQ